MKIALLTARRTGQVNITAIRSRWRAAMRWSHLLRGARLRVETLDRRLRPVDRVDIGFRRSHDDIRIGAAPGSRTGHASGSWQGDAGLPLVLAGSIGIRGTADL